MATRSSSSEASGLLFWRISLAFTSVFTMFWLLATITDWIPRAFRVYEPFRAFDNYNLVDALALFVNRNHMWLLVTMALLNVLAVVVCYLGTRRLPITVPMVIHVAMFVLLGGVIILSDVWLCTTGLNATDEAFTMTLMWCLLAVPLWIFVARALWESFGKRRWRDSHDR